MKKRAIVERNLLVMNAHYNKKLNQCFILITDLDVSQKIVVKILVDALSRKEYGGYTGNLLAGTSIWKVLDKSGEGDEGWNNLIRPYMEE